jgi:hypothetical protein
MAFASYCCRNHNVGSRRGDCLEFEPNMPVDGPTLVAVAALGVSIKSQRQPGSESVGKSVLVVWPPELGQRRSTM